MVPFGTSPLAKVLPMETSWSAHDAMVSKFSTVSVKRTCPACCAASTVRVMLWVSGKPLTERDAV